MDPLTTTAALPPIEGLCVRPLRQIRDARGAVLHMLRADAPWFERFGEIYFSEVNPGVAKAWKCHRLMTQHFAVPAGRIRLVVFDDRQDSATRGQVADLILGRPDRYDLVSIRPGLWYGFQGLAAHPSLLANCADLPHDPLETRQRPVEDGAMPAVW